jgi:hypothetical protein
MFKFIIKEKNTKKLDIQNIFKGMNPTFATKKSSNNNFTSLTISLKMQNPESVIKIYKRVSKFKGVIVF